MIKILLQLRYDTITGIAFVCLPNIHYNPAVTQLACIYRLRTEIRS